MNRLISSTLDYRVTTTCRLHLSQCRFQGSLSIYLLRHEYVQNCILHNKCEETIVFFLLQKRCFAITGSKNGADFEETLDEKLRVSF